MGNSLNKNGLFLDKLNDLKLYYQQKSLFDIKKLFHNDSIRSVNFSLQNDDLLFDFSRQPIDKVALEKLLDLAKIAQLEQKRQDMFCGKKINITENRAALHIALRATQDNIYLDHKIRHDIAENFSRMFNFVDRIWQGRYLGASKKQITDVVNIGIGGSDLGPHMVSNALKNYHGKIKCHFVASLDHSDITDCLEQLNPEQTLFIVTSKSFTSVETLANANYAKAWLIKALGEETIKQHFVAVTEDLAAAQNFGIRAENCFLLWQWLGGRFSLWGAPGLSIMLAIGVKNFQEFLAGAADLDKNFLNAQLKQNIAVIFGLLSYYNRVCAGYNNITIVPYAHRLDLFIDYLQQLLMESNCKSVNKAGENLNFPSGAIIWGGIGSNVQHAFFQFLHQGTEITPVEFIAFAKLAEESRDKLLLANCLAQSEALLWGSDKIENKLYKYCAGNRPSLLLLQRELSPRSLGFLLALYENRVFVEGVMFDVNSFDQWGVELGKKLAIDFFDNYVKDKKYFSLILEFLAKNRL